MKQDFGTLRHRAREWSALVLGGIVGATLRAFVVQAGQPFSYTHRTQGIVLSRLETIRATEAVSGFPWSTLGVNLVGTFLLGAVAVVSKSATVERRWLWLALGAGLCGSLTTFSSFAVEVAVRLKIGASLEAAAYVALSLLGGAIAVAAGVKAATAAIRLGVQR